MDASHSLSYLAGTAFCTLPSRKSPSKSSSSSQIASCFYFTPVLFFLYLYLLLKVGFLVLFCIFLLVYLFLFIFLCLSIFLHIFTNNKDSFLNFQCPFCNHFICLWLGIFCCVPFILWTFSSVTHISFD